MKWILVVMFLAPLPGQHGYMDYPVELAAPFATREGCVAVGQALTYDNVGIVGFGCVDSKRRGADADDVDTILNTLERWAEESAAE